MVLKYFQFISIFYPWFWRTYFPVIFSNSNLYQKFYHYFPNNYTSYFSISIVCNYYSVYFNSLPWVYIYFFHFQDWFSLIFFSIFYFINFHHYFINFYFLYLSIFISLLFVILLVLPLYDLYYNIYFFINFNYLILSYL